MTAKTVMFACMLAVATVAQAATYTGSLTYTPGPPPDSGDGLFVTGPASQWSSYTVTLEWTVTNEDASQPGYAWKYQYRFRHNGSQYAFSHVILETASDFTTANMAVLTGAAFDSLKVQTVQSGNPAMPEDVFGLRFNPLSGGVKDMTWSFFSDRAPMWGDFYGRCGGGPGGDQVNSAYNFNQTGSVQKGFLDPNASNTNRDDPDPSAPAASGSVDYHLLVPGVVPEPATLAVVAVGAAMLLWRRRRLSPWVRSVGCTKPWPDDRRGWIALKH